MFLGCWNVKLVVCSAGIVDVLRIMVYGCCKWLVVWSRLALPRIIIIYSRPPILVVRPVGNNRFAISPQTGRVGLEVSGLPVSGGWLCA